MVTFGVTTFSVVPDIRWGADLESILTRLSEAGCGPALEVIGHQVFRSFPELSAEAEKDFCSQVDRLGFEPVALGVYPDLFRDRRRPMTVDQAFDDLRPQLAAARRLGIGLVRAPLGMDSALLRRAAAEAEQLEVVLTVEVQGLNSPQDPAVVEVLELRERTSTPYLGLTLDFSLTTPHLPAAFDTALRRFGASDEAVSAVHDAWWRDEPVGPRMQAAFAAVGDLPRQDEIRLLVAGMFPRTGRQEPADWAEALPAVRHVHGKFWDPDVESVRDAHGAWLAALVEAGYDGAVVSEWGGHELLDRHEADAVQAVAAHQELLRQLSGATNTHQGATL
jgi:sugar phosphate isomerase/epimerase